MCWNWRYSSKHASAYRTLLARHSVHIVGAVVRAACRRFAMEVSMILDLVPVRDWHLTFGDSDNI